MICVKFDYFCILFDYSKLMETNEQLELAKNYVEQTNVNVFLTGKAGTGKTTFLKGIVETLFKRFVVLAPTGVAALNAQGVTIHSFFQLDFAPFIPNSTSEKDKKAIRKEKLNLIRSLDMIIIDEISMVRADVLDAVDKMLKNIRRNSQPFGGVQMLLIGDLRQLPPVAVDNEWDLLRSYYSTPYFFSSYAWQQSNFVTIILEQVFRQTDKRFISILNSVRDNKISDDIVDALNERYIPNFQNDEGYIRLCTHNYQSKQINDEKLYAIKNPVYRYEANIEGEFPENIFPNDRVLELKVGAQVMFIKNDYGVGRKRMYHNGKLGRVIELTDDRIVVEDEDSQRIYVHKDMWKNYRYKLNKDRSIEQSVIGTFEQYPIKTAWAITIHKSQGLTFDKAIIDSNKAFANGQVYVALSRCRSMEGIVLCSKFDPYSVMIDGKVSAFNANQREIKPDSDTLERDKKQYILDAMKELFDFSDMNTVLEKIYRLNDEDISRFYESASAKIKDITAFAKNEIVNVAAKFLHQIDVLAKENEQALNKRIEAAQKYFITSLQKINTLIFILQSLEFDNKDTEYNLESLTNDLATAKEIKHRLLKSIENKPFDVVSYVRLRNDLLAQGERLKPNSVIKEKSAQIKEENDRIKEENDKGNEELYEALRQWRRTEAERINMPAYFVLSQKALLNISNSEPETMKELAEIKGIGKKTMEKYGETLIDIIANNVLKQ